MSRNAILAARVCVVADAIRGRMPSWAKDLYEAAGALQALPDASEGPAKRYKELRQYCLQVAGFDPASDAPCHEALANINERYLGQYTLRFAQLLDDVMRTRPPTNYCSASSRPVLNLER